MISNNFIVGNNVSSNSYAGIRLSYSYNNTIDYNNVSLNDYIGIRLINSSWNIIKNNTIFNNQVGVQLHASKSNTICRNTIISNLRSFYLRITTSDNVIYHNNLINNSYQPRDYTDNGNQWDNGYPMGGNYWDDYSGIDNFKGPSQDITGNDGFGDTNYSIDSDSIDHYPLMSPYGNYLFLYEGWNLISIPAIQPEYALSSVLSSISGLFDAVQWYNTTDLSDHWKHITLRNHYF